MFQKHCPGCFENKQALASCPYCGYDESAPRSPLLLPHGTILANTYRIGRVLGRPGGFGVTYLAWDTQLQQRVAVKEYLPRDKVSRDPATLQVNVHVPEQVQHFNFGLDQFLSEARIIAKFDHPNIVRVRNFFRAYGTAYLVMDYYEGRSLGDYLAHLEQPVEMEAAGSMMCSVLDGLQFVHDRGVLHRDVKPHNIYMTNSGRVILLDFGAARQAAGGSRVDSISVVLSEGYAPLEQYQKNSPQGPWTDIYGVAATLYRMLKGAPPVVALDRLGTDPLDEDFELPEKLTAVLRKALALRPQERYSSAIDFKMALIDALGIEPQAVTTTRGLPGTPEPETKTVAWGNPSESAFVKRNPNAQAAATTQSSALQWGPAWLIAGAIVLGAILISLPLWLHR